jgi:hypothetical protein
MHQNEFFFIFVFFFFDISTSKPSKSIKNIKLMFFQAKRTFEKHLKAEAEVLPNTPEPNTKTLKW